MPIVQVMSGKFPRNFSVRFSGLDSHNSDAMATYIAQKIMLALDAKYTLHPGKIDKSGSTGQFYVWEFGLQSSVTKEYTAKLVIKQPWGGQQIWFWIAVNPLPQFRALPAFQNDNIILNYLRYNP